MSLTLIESLTLSNTLTRLSVIIHKLSIISYFYQTKS